MCTVCCRLTTQSVFKLTILGKISTIYKILLSLLDILYFANCKLCKKLNIRNFHIALRSVAQIETSPFCALLSSLRGRRTERRGRGEVKLEREVRGQREAQSLGSCSFPPPSPLYAGHAGKFLSKSGDVVHCIFCQRHCCFSDSELFTITVPRNDLLTYLHTSYMLI